MYIKYNTTTGEITGQVGFMNFNDPDVISVDDLVYGSTVNPKIDPVTKALVAQPLDPAVLQKQKDDLVSKVNDLCSSKIENGLTSAALGQNYIYQTSPLDQFNLFVNMTKANKDSVNVMQRCVCVATGVDTYISHTPAQITKVFDDGYTQILSFLQHAGMLKNQIKAVTDTTTLIAIDINSGW